MHLDTEAASSALSLDPNMGPVSGGQLPACYGEHSSLSVYIPNHLN